MNKNQKKKVELSMQQQDLDAVVNSEIDWEQYRNSTVLVTGATGLIGSLILKSILRCNKIKNYNIKAVAVCRDLKKAYAVFGEAVGKELEIYINDVRNPMDYDKPIDYIFHTASITASKTMVEDPVNTIHTSYQGTYNTLEFARKKDVKGIVYLSSMEVYGKVDASTEKIYENNLGYIDIGNVRSSYSEGKRICECLCTAFGSEYNVPVKIARLAQTFGAGVFENDNRVYAQFARSALRREDIVLHTDGLSDGNYCYTSDAVKALFMLAYMGDTGEAYNIVNEESHMTIKDMAQLVAELVNNEIKIIYDIPTTQIYGYAPSVKMKLSNKKMRDLGWTPYVGLKEAYKRMMYDMKV